MLDLTDQAWTKDTPLSEQAALDGKVYTVGVGQQAQSLVFYNKDAFAKAGISAPPKDLDELTAAMGKLKAAGYLPLQTAGDYVTGLQLLQLGDPSIATEHPDWYQKVNAKDLSSASPCCPLLERYESWIKNGYVDKNALGLKGRRRADQLPVRQGRHVHHGQLVRPDRGRREAGVRPRRLRGPAEPASRTRATGRHDGRAVHGAQVDRAARPLGEAGAVAGHRPRRRHRASSAQDGNFRKGFTDKLSPLGRAGAGHPRPGAAASRPGRGVRREHAAARASTASGTRRSRASTPARSPKDVAKGVDPGWGRHDTWTGPPWRAPHGRSGQDAVSMVGPAPVLSS